MIDDLSVLIQAQRRAFARDGAPSVEARRASLAALRGMVSGNQGRLVEAMNADFGGRSPYETLLTDVMPTTAIIDHLSRHLKKWMAPERRSVAWYFLPGRARVEFQPLGVVGIIAPWNYPVNLSLGPLATAIAAGNRVLLKPSELTPATSDLLAELLGGIFAREEVAVVLGDASVGAAFARLPFDHLFFTGSTAVGRKVMAAASENLVPVTLELGGKSPAIVTEHFAVDKAAASIAAGKLLNAGQTCIAPDYALVPTERVCGFVGAYHAAANRLYPSWGSASDYTHIISEQHRQRLRDLVDDAQRLGAMVTSLGDAVGAGAVAPVVLTDVTSDMRVMQEEIFGPILPVVAYDGLDVALRYVNERPRPLALYLFSDDAIEQERVLRGTTSGNVTLNDTLLHVVQDNLPFGGVGASGMGAYHGYEGFRTFSHAKGIFSQSRINGAGFLRPPYGPRTAAILRHLIK